MRFVHYLQHWVSGVGTCLQVTDFVPESHPIRRWADTFPWEALVQAIEQSFQKRFPKTSRRGRRPLPIRVLLALELLEHELGASDADIVTVFVPTSLLCTPVACGSPKPSPLRPTLCCPKRCVSFALVLTRP